MLVLDCKIHLSPKNIKILKDSRKYNFSITLVLWLKLKIFLLKLTFVST